MKTSQLTDSTRVSIGVYKPMINIIQEVVCRHCGISVSQSRSHCQKQNLVKARRLIFYFTRTMLPGCSLFTLGHVSGNGRPFSHSTISISYAKIMFDLHQRDRSGQLVYPEVMAEVNKLRNEIFERFEASRQEPTVKRCFNCGHIIP